MLHDEEKIKQSVCPQCGQTFTCSTATGKCWCQNFSISDENLKLLKTRYKTCLCPSCLAAFSEKVNDSSCKRWFFSIFALAIGFRGRVARQRSAKPCTAVRIRSKPQQKAEWFSFGLFYFCSIKIGSHENESKKTDRIRSSHSQKLGDMDVWS